MEQNELNTILSYIDETIERMFKKYLAKPNPSEDEMTERQASKEFGRGWVLSTRHQERSIIVPNCWL